MNNYDCYLKLPKHDAVTYIHTYMQIQAAVMRANNRFGHVKIDYSKIYNKPSSFIHEQFKYSGSDMKSIATLLECYFSRNISS